MIKKLDLLKKIFTRIALSCIAVWGLMVMLSVYEKGLFLSQPLPKSQRTFRASMQAHLENPEGRASRKGLHYPAFPSRRRVQSNPTKINGVRVSSERFETTVSGRAVVDFYRDQMSARGWRDVTDDVHGRTSESIVMSEALGAASQQQNAMDILNTVSHSELIMQGVDHMMHLKLQRGKSPMWTDVVIVVSKTKTTDEMVSFMDAGLREALPRRGLTKFMDVTEYGRLNHYHTQQWISREKPEDVFSYMVDDLNEEGWAAAAPLLNKVQKDGFFGTFIRNDHYAVLSVLAHHDIKGSLVSLSITE